MLLKQKSYDLTEGPVRKMLVLFVLPIIAGSLFQQLYTTADAAIVGRFAGKQALAAIDAVYNLIPGVEYPYILQSYLHLQLCQ